MRITTCRLGDDPEVDLDDDRLTRLAWWGVRLSRLGIAPGAAGNLSVRMEPDFVITRTEVELGSIGPKDWVRVTGLRHGEDGGLEVDYRGSSEPSRDSYVHGTVYERQPGAGAIFHLHDRDMLVAAPRLGITSTRRYFPAGTTDSVAEIEQLLADHPSAAYFVLVDHGIVAWAEGVDQAGRLVEEHHRRARADHG